MPSKKIETLLKIIIPENEQELCARNIPHTKVRVSCSDIHCEKCVMDDMQHPSKIEVVRILNGQSENKESNKDG